MKITGKQNMVKLSSAWEHPSQPLPSHENKDYKRHLHKVMNKLQNEPQNIMMLTLYEKMDL